MKLFYSPIFITLFLAQIITQTSYANNDANVSSTSKSTNTIAYTEQQITIDGKLDSQWKKASWRPLDQHILGALPTAEDFNGQYKMLWDEGMIYIVAEITDDLLMDQHADPLFKYWDDDCLEIFIDEDASGGDHLFNFNAFAYHIALDNQAVDMGEQLPNNPDNFILLNDHIKSVWKRDAKQPNKIVWEVAVKIYDENYQHPNLNNQHQPVNLTAGKVIGFMLAYCDNDGSEEREHFIGSTSIKPVNGDKNLGFKTADVFEQFTLIK